MPDVLKLPSPSSWMRHRWRFGFKIVGWNKRNEWRKDWFLLTLQLLLPMVTTVTAIRVQQRNRTRLIRPHLQHLLPSWRLDFFFFPICLSRTLVVICQYHFYHLFVSVSFDSCLAFLFNFNSWWLSHLVVYFISTVSTDWQGKLAWHQTTGQMKPTQGDKTV